MKNIILKSLKTGKFVVTARGRSSEYPDAQVFESRKDAQEYAKAASALLSEPIGGYTRYGTTQETEIFTVNE